MVTIYRYIYIERENRGPTRVKSRWYPGHQKSEQTTLFVRSLEPRVSVGYYVYPNPYGEGTTIPTYLHDSTYT